MTSPSKALSTEVGNLNHQNAFRADGERSYYIESHLEHKDDEEEEDEEEDVDFNPFLKESPSLEASSSLSCEVEVFDADVADSKGSRSATLGTNLSPMPPGQVQDYAFVDLEHGEEIVVQTAISSGGACEKESKETSLPRFKKRKAVLISQPENKTFHKKENGSSSAMDIVSDSMIRDTNHSRNPVVDVDDEDAICKRTRARYSLASFTLDELETFLQETDDDDDLQNVDDEEEYRKFLAAVLQGGDDDSQIRRGNENVDDEDEENDADFEIEIEEALESDLEENTRVDTQADCGTTGRRPETRQNKRQKASVQQKNRLFGQANRPLRPLLPNAPIASFPVLLPEVAPQSLSSSGHDGFINGFTPSQLGQLHCLLHEHVQLLIQVFSLCVLEPSRQHISSQIQELISEMLHKRDEVISWRRVPHTCFCFCPPYIHPSVQHGLSKSLTTPRGPESACSFDEQRDYSSETNKGRLPVPISSKEGSETNEGRVSVPISSKERSVYPSNGQEGCFQTSDSTSWMLSVNGPILSILDVAPLSLVGKYMDDVSIAVREYQKQRVHGACDTYFNKEPLFPFHHSQHFTEANAEVARGTTLPSTNVPSYSAGDQPHKKTLAAALVERTKKQSIAPVPKEIVKLAQRFLPLFNPDLFPHKPPPAPVANRVLFTDAEDELLALGLMEYNTDWKAIQQRFLPCKSKHQIFVRQKNRSSSKAPENSIKAVRRMKSSPLTAEEIARIQEGLKVFKLDWMSVWKFVVPYRDPSLLPRQWRIATGTQKSYKSTADKKEKRRLYESNRRKRNPAALASWQTLSVREDFQIDNAGGEINSGDDCMDNDDEAYVHEAFLADWRPGGSYAMEQENNSGLGETQPQFGLGLPASFKYSQNLDNLSHFTNTKHYSSVVEPSHPISDMTTRPSQSQFCSQSYRSRKASNARLVKLAPDLPPVNLPPSVRVMSQSAFKSYKGGTSTKVQAAGTGIGSVAKEKIVLPLSRVANSGSTHPIKSSANERNPMEKSNSNQHRQESFALRNKCVAGDKGESDLQMHPLLFQSYGDGRLSYYPLNCSSGTSSFSNFFSRIQPQLNLSLLYNPHHENQAVNHFDKSSKSKETTSSAGGIDFHPLLQKADNVSSDSVAAHSSAQLSVNLEPLRSSCAQIQKPHDAFQSESRVNTMLSTGPKSSTPNEKANELDLEIHLSFTSSKEKSVGNNDVTEHNPTTSTLSALGSGTTMETQATASILNRIKNFDSGASPLLVSSNDTAVYGANHESDQSAPEIIMEHEELSDSEEEIGEVEFECEEMDDSEGDEGSDPERIMDMQKEEVPNGMRDETVRDSNFDDQQLVEGSAGRNCAASCSNRPGKKPPTNRRHAAAQRHATDMLQLQQQEKLPGSVPFDVTPQEDPP